MQSPVKGVENILERFSDWKRIKVAVGWFLIAKDNLRKIVIQKREREEKMKNSGIPEEKITKNEYMGSEAILKKSKIVKIISYLNTDILDRAERELIAYEQRRYYAIELKDLGAKHGHVKRSSQLSRLDPFLHEGVLKVGGRLEKLNVPFTTKHQMIVSKNSILAKMIAVDAHRSTGHLGKNSTLAVIREKFWIPGISSLLKSLISKCRRYQFPPMQQKMSNLPAERLKADDPPFTYVGMDPPFTYEGMDYFGPFELKRGRSMVKRCGVILLVLTPEQFILKFHSPLIQIHVLMLFADSSHGEENRSLSDRTLVRIS